jgi:predicted nucleic acid-binding protein
MEFALAYEVMVYDACYLAQAGLVGLPLATAEVAPAKKSRESEIKDKQVGFR